MEIIKKNILLSVVIALAVISSCVLAYFAYVKEASVDVALSELEIQKKKVVVLNNTTPAPVKANLDKLNSDIAKAKKKLDTFKKSFGFPYSIALSKFAVELGITKAVLVKDWRQFLKKDNKSGNSISILIMFLQKFDRIKLKKASELFTDDVQKLVFEDVKGDVVKEYLLEALGVPRNMPGSRCSALMKRKGVNICKLLEVDFSIYKNQKNGINNTISNEHRDLVAINKINFSTPTVHLDPSVANFTFSDYKGKVPLQEDVIVLLKHWSMIEDLVLRIKKASISNIKSLTKDALKVPTKDGFITFKYNIVIQSDMKNIRAFINSLQNGFVQNRIYIVNKVSIRKIEDSANKFMSDNLNKRTRLNSGSDNLSDIKIGSESLCEAEIKFSYIMCIEDEIKLNN